MGSHGEDGVPLGDPGEPGIAAAEVAQRLVRPVLDHTAGVDGLQERGLVQRTPDPGDRRAVILRPTDEGRRIRDQIDAARTADCAELYGRLSATDRSALARVLHPLTDRPGEHR